MTTPAPPVRFCPVCRVADDHPRHDIARTDPNVAPHMDCCAASGCPDGSCDIVIRNKGKATGDKFREMIVAQAAETVELLAQRDEATAHFTVDDLDPAVHGSVVAGPVELQQVTR